ncbi:MAG: LysM peptidoglycan-binding domain-containing protein [Planctomycetota bacterium]
MRVDQQGRTLGWLALATLIGAGLGGVSWLVWQSRAASRETASVTEPESARVITSRAVAVLAGGSERVAEPAEAPPLPVARAISRGDEDIPAPIWEETDLGILGRNEWGSVRPRASGTEGGVYLEISGPPDHYFVAFVGPGDSEVLLPVAAGRIDESGTATLPAIFPSEAALRVPDLSPDRYYVVQEGDSPFDIARRYYGNEQLWRQILRRNRFELGELHPGEVLVLPHPAPEDLPFGSSLDVNRETVFVRLAIVPPGWVR